MYECVNILFYWCMGVCMCECIYECVSVWVCVYGFIGV